MYFSCQWRDLTTSIIYNNCDFLKRIFRLFIRIVFTKKSSLYGTLVYGPDYWPRSGVWFLSVSRMRAEYLANGIYMSQLLDLGQIGRTWFRSTCPGHYGVFYSDNAALTRSGAFKFDRSILRYKVSTVSTQTTSLQRRTVTDGMMS